MVKSSPVLYKCMLRHVPPIETGAGGSKRVQDVIDLVTDMGLLIKHSDGCFTINPKSKPHTEAIRKRSNSNGDLLDSLGVPPKGKEKKRGRKVKKRLKPWTVTSQRFPRPKPRRRHKRRGSRRGRSMTRAGARRRHKKCIHKNMKQKRDRYKKKTLRKFFKVMRRLSDSFTNVPTKTKKMV